MSAAAPESEKPKGGFAVLWRFLPMLWPKDDAGLRLRVVAALILVLARKIGNEAKRIDDSLKKSVVNTAALADLGNTNQMAVNVIQGLERGRKRLGG